MLQLFNAIFNIFFSLFEAIVAKGADIVVAAVPERRDTTYNAMFVPPGKLFRKGGGGFSIGEYSNSLDESTRHMICLGGSGSKKSTAIVYNTVLQSPHSSQIILDTSSELLRGMGTALQETHTICVINLHNPSTSEGINVLYKGMSYAEIHRVANTLVRNSLEGSDYDFWVQSAEAVIAFCCKYLVTYAEPEYVNLSNVLHLIRALSVPEQLDERMTHISEELSAEYKALIATSPNTLQSILATCRTAMRIYENPDIARITSTSTFSFEQLHKERYCVFICSSAADSALYRPVIATLFQSLFAHILSQPPYQKDELPLRVIIDEAATIHINLSQALSLARKHNVSIATFWQDFNQIESRYGRSEAANIFANSYLKVFMPSGQPLATCKMLSEMLGKYSYEVDGQTKIRELLTAQEIHQLDKMLVLMGNNHPTLIEATQYFNIPKLRHMTDKPPYVPKNTNLPFPRYLPLDET